MTEIEIEGFNDDEKAASSGFWIYKRLKDEYKDACYRLVKGGGPLGWDNRTIRAAHIKMASVEIMVKHGYVTKAPLWAFAEELLRKEKEGEIHIEQDPDMSNPKERDQWLLLERAKNIFENKTLPENIKFHYQVASEQLYGYIECFIE
jgi:hypothetical protein